MTDKQERNRLGQFMGVALQDRFWRYVDKSDDDACWLWQGSLGYFGHGKMNVDGVTHTAHRMSWRLHRGEIPNALFVLHRCDNPNCVNPRHLFLGTQADNMADMMSKNRFPNREGENNPASKLTEEDVLGIHYLLSVGRPVSEIAKHYLVGEGAIYNIKSGKTWRHIGEK